MVTSHEACIANSTPASTNYEHDSPKVVPSVDIADGVSLTPTPTTFNQESLVSLNEDGDSYPMKVEDALTPTPMSTDFTDENIILPMDTVDDEATLIPTGSDHEISLNSTDPSQVSELVEAASDALAAMPESMQVIMLLMSDVIQTNPEFENECQKNPIILILVLELMASPAETDEAAKQDVFEANPELKSECEKDPTVLIMAENIMTVMDTEAEKIGVDITGVMSEFTESEDQFEAHKLHQEGIASLVPTDAEY